MSAIPAAAGAELSTALKSGEESLGEIFSSAFDAELLVEVGELETLSNEDFAKDWGGPGVRFRFPAGAAEIVGMLQAQAEFVPEWCRTPDDQSQQKLDTLGELLRAAFPESLSLEPSTVELADDLSSAVPSPDDGDEFCCLLITLKPDEGEGTALFALAWTATGTHETSSAETPSKSEAMQSVEPAPSDTPSLQPEQSPARPRRQVQYETLEEGLDQLPPYAKSLLKIQVPVKVNLAESKVTVSRVLELGPGTILQFQKSCEETLTLEAGDQQIAVGEAVKVGDKFGLWITAIAMPDERFWIMKGEMPERIR